MSPDVFTPVDSTERDSAMDVPSDGALFIAEAAYGTSALVAVAPQRVRGSFAGLGITPHLASYARTVDALSHLVIADCYWETARLSANSLSATRRNQAHQSILALLFGVICGPTWQRSESAYLESHDFTATATSMKASLTHDRTDAGIAAALGLRSPDDRLSAPEERLKIFCEVLGSFLGNKDLDQAGFALRLATSPLASVTSLRNASNLSPRPFGELRGTLALGLTTLLNSPRLARLARYWSFLCASEHYRRRPEDVSWLPAAWEW